MKKLLSALCILMAAVFLISGCGSSSGGGKSSGDEASGGAADSGARTDIIVSLRGEPAHLCGGFASQSLIGLVSLQIFDNLLRFDEINKVYSPMLATSWEYANDNKEIIFTLRDDVIFHNGEKMTADDVAFSFNTIIEEEIADSITNAMDHMEIIDDTHVKLIYKTVYGPALKTIASFNVPVFCRSAYESDPTGFLRNPVGSGPYKFSEWKTGDSITLVAHEQYWAGAPAIKTLVFKFFEDDSTASLALQNGEIDVHLTPPVSDRARLEANPKLQYLRAGSIEAYYIFFSVKEGTIFANEDLRLAVAYAIDKEAVLQGAVNGEGTILETIYPTIVENVDLSYRAPTNDPEKAKEHLALGGYPDGFEFTVVTTSIAARYRPLEIVQGQLAAVGITMHLEKVEVSTWWSDIHDGRNFVMGSMNGPVGLTDIDDTYSLFRGGEPLNNYELDDPELNVAFDAERSSIDPDVRRPASYDIVRILGDRAYCIPLFEPFSDIAADVNLKGIVPTVNAFDCRIFDWSW